MVPYCASPPHIAHAIFALETARLVAAAHAHTKPLCYSMQLNRSFRNAIFISVYLHRCQYHDMQISSRTSSNLYLSCRGHMLAMYGTIPYMHSETLHSQPHIVIGIHPLLDYETYEQLWLTG